MKKVIVSIFCTVLISNMLSAQIVVSSDNTTKKNEVQEAQDLGQATIRTYYHFTQKSKKEDKIAFRNDTMTLDVGPQVSYYYDETKSKKDSLFNHAITNLNPNTIKSISVYKGNNPLEFDNLAGDKYEMNYYDGTTEKIFKNRVNGEITIIDHSSDAYMCVDPVASFGWKIMDETAVVLDYTCQKATAHFRGRDYEAWFSSEIPVNDGPWKFFGLPGMILRVNDTEGLIAFECIGLQFLDEPYTIAIPVKKYIKCSWKELQKVMKNRGGGTGLAIDGGNVTLVNKELSPSFTPLELK